MPLDAETRGERARQILENDVFREAVSAAKLRLQNAWAATEDPGRRDALWHEFQAVDVVVKELTIIRDNGIVQRKKHEREERDRG